MNNLLESASAGSLASDLLTFKGLQEKESLLSMQLNSSGDEPSETQQLLLGSPHSAVTLMSEIGSGGLTTTAAAAGLVERCATPPHQQSHHTTTTGLVNQAFSNTLGKQQASLSSATSVGSSSIIMPGGGSGSLSQAPNFKFKLNLD